MRSRTHRTRTVLRGAVAVLLAGALWLLTCCGHAPRHRQYDPASVRFGVHYESMFDNVLYPSMLLALSTYTGDTMPRFFTCSVTAPVSNAVLRVVVDSSKLNYVTILQEVLPRRGQTYTFVVDPKWKYDNLYRTRQQGMLDLTFTCYINDEEVDVKNLRVNYRSVNDCLLTAIDTNKRAHDFRWLFMAYVNEDHPYIDSILTAALQQGIVSRFVGYQRGSRYVADQVFAVWHYALCHGISYSSISCTANPSPRASTQHIRFFDEVYNTRQANCIDACVFFASILRKIGLYPVILVEPCHAYLGYYLDKDKRRLALLETTITSWVNIPALDRTYAADSALTETQWTQLRRYLTAAEQTAWADGTLSWDDLKLAVSRNLFAQATDYHREDYAANRQAFLDNTRNDYQMLVVDELRRFVQPIAYGEQ